ncbi:MAG: type II secretion system protein [Candidatus Paceibacterota bacterium]|jgi:prepilin-type N-terminal cleavage/methylation domain-containing protein
MKNNKGLTLIETLVSIVLFGIISTLLINIFIVSIRTQTRIIANQELVEQSTYALDYMANKIRMAVKDETGYCNGLISNYVTGTNSIRFISYDAANSKYVCREFILEGNAVKERISSDETSVSLGTPTPITSSSFNVSNLVFSLNGDDSTHQPKITIAITMSKESSKELTVQTTISQRRLNI